MRCARRRSRRVLAVLVLVGVLVASACGTEADVVEPDDEPPPPVARDITIYFTNTDRGEIGEVFPVARRTTDDDLPLAALSALLAGPTAEEVAAGYSSWFSPATAGSLNSLEVAEGLAHADFDAALRELIPGASSSAGSAALFAELDTTLTQFDEIADTVYSLDGDVGAFYEWLQYDAPTGAPEPREPDEPDEPVTPDEPDAVEPVEPTQATVRVFFNNLDRGDVDEVFPVERTVETPRVLHGALTALLQGPTADEEDAGYWSWFSEETAGMLRSVRIEDGVAFVDFDAGMRETIPGASSSAGSAALLASLDATVTQFPTVSEARYALDGDVPAFYEWLQLDAPGS
jgi:spore germination protein GerM